MGYKASMITVANPSREIEETTLLASLGFGSYVQAGKTNFASAIYPGDRSVSIGWFNNCLIICDDNMIIAPLDTYEPQEVLPHENILTKLYHGCEVLAVSCHSSVNYHAYSLAKDGEKLRLKRIADGYPLVEFGDRLPEEDKVYSLSTMVKGERLFRSNYGDSEEYEYTEDQMMEAFAFGVAKRHLGVMISTGEDEQLMEIEMNRYVMKAAEPVKAEPSEESAEQAPPKRKWYGKLFVR